MHAAVQVKLNLSHLCLPRHCVLHWHLVRCWQLWAPREKCRSDNVPVVCSLLPAPFSRTLQLGSDRVPRPGSTCILTARVICWTRAARRVACPSILLRWFQIAEHLAVVAAVCADSPSLLIWMLHVLQSSDLLLSCMWCAQKTQEDSHQACCSVPCCLQLRSDEHLYVVGSCQTGGVLLELEGHYIYSVL